MTRGSRRVRPSTERRRILITGASSGLGAEMARQFAAAGHDLALCARRLDRLNELRAEIQKAQPGRTVAIRSLDVDDHEAVFAVFRDFAGELGGLDRVIVNAGLGKGAPIGTGRFDANKQTITTNLLSALAQCEAALEHFRDGERRPPRGDLVGVGAARYAEVDDRLRRVQGGHLARSRRASGPSSTAPRSRSPRCCPATSCRR